jgi:hypothetical protein
MKNLAYMVMVVVVTNLMMALIFWIWYKHQWDKKEKGIREFELQKGGTPIEANRI